MVMVKKEINERKNYIQCFCVLSQNFCVHPRKFAFFIVKCYLLFKFFNLCFAQKKSVPMKEVTCTASSRKPFTKHFYR